MLIFSRPSISDYQPDNLYNYNYNDIDALNADEARPFRRQVNNDPPKTV
jgi:hypothetical protein